MKVGKGLALSLAVASGLAGIVVSALPATAAGDTGREHGCAAHWRNTANWNECVNAPNVNVQLQVDCVHGHPIDHYSAWVRVNGSKDPVSRFECQFRTQGAWNAFRF